MIQPTPRRLTRRRLTARSLGTPILGTPSLALSVAAVALGIVSGLASGCASGSSSGSGGAGGAGTSSKSATGGTTATSSTSSGTSSSTSTSTATATSATSSTGSSMGPCDNGAHGSLNPGATAAEIQICKTCVACSQMNQCKAQWQAYAADPNAQAHSMCLTACGSDQTCLDNCATMYPNADALLSTAIVCSLCTECTSNCDAAGSGC